MAQLKFDTYDNLKLTLASWLNRSDMVDQIPAFIQLAEAEIASRIRRTSVVATITIADDSNTLPGDCAELRSVRLVSAQPSDDTPILIGSVEQLTDFRAGRANTIGRPRRAAALGKQLLVAPTPDQAYDAEVVYFQGLTPLSDAVQTNTVLQERPDLYLYGPLMHAAPFLEEDERVAVWEAKWEKAIAQLELVRLREETNASLKPARLPVVIG